MDLRFLFRIQWRFLMKKNSRCFNREEVTECGNKKSSKALKKKKNREMVSPRDQENFICVVKYGCQIPIIVTRNVE